MTVESAFAVCFPAAERAHCYAAFASHGWGELADQCRPKCVEALGSALTTGSRVPGEARGDCALAPCPSTRRGSPRAVSRYRPLDVQALRCFPSTRRRGLLARTSTHTTAEVVLWTYSGWDV